MSLGESLSVSIAVPTAPGGVVVPTAVVPAAMIPPPFALAEGSGSGTGSVVVVAVITKAQAMGSGTGVVAARPLVSSQGSGSGAGSVVAYDPSTAASAAGSGSGSGVVTASPAVVASATGAGTGTSTARPAVTAAASGSGTGAVTARASVKSAGSGSGSGTVNARLHGPTILASDDFARSADNLTTPWTKRMNFGSDNFAIDSSQRAYRTGSGANDSSDGVDAYMHQTDLGSQDQYGRVLVRVFASGSASPPGVVLRGIAPNSGQALFGQVWSSGWRILVATPGGGSRTTLQSGTGSFTAGSNIELQVRSGVVTLKYAGVELAVLSQPSIPTGTYGGFSAGQNANRVDDVALGTFV